MNDARPRLFFVSRGSAAEPVGGLEETHAN